MLFRRDILQGIVDGRVTLAFRRWRRAPPADASSLLADRSWTCVGTAPRNSVLGPGFARVDFALAKTWSLGASQLEFRWEVFNLLNRANFDLPSRIYGNADFGRIFSAKNSREMQFGIRLAF